MARADSYSHTVFLYGEHVLHTHTFVCTHKHTRTNTHTLTVDKTVMMMFDKTGASIELNISLIPQVHSTKFLGTWLDDKLSWSTHITILKKILQSRRGLLGRSKNFLSTHCMRILYFAQIQSILTYGIVAWGPMIKQSDLKSLQQTQDNCMRCICAKNPLAEIYETLCVLPVSKLIQLKQAKRDFGLCNDLLPLKLSEALLTDYRSVSITK